MSPSPTSSLPRTTPANLHLPASSLDMRYVLLVTGLAAAATALPQGHAACATNLNGDFTAPDLIVPVSSTQPNTAYGTQYVAEISNAYDTLFQFNLPSSYSGMTCSLLMLLPSSANVQSFSGDGVLNFALMSHQVTASTTWSSKGGVETNHGNLTVAEGHNYLVATFSCPAGYELTYQVSSATGGTNTTFFETTQSPPVGLYVRAC